MNSDDTKAPERKAPRRRKGRRNVNAKKN